MTLGQVVTLTLTSRSGVVPPCVIKCNVRCHAWLEKSFDFLTNIFTKIFWYIYLVLLHVVTGQWSVVNLKGSS